MNNPNRLRLYAIAFSLLTSVVTPVRGQISDTTPPRLVNVTIVPNSVNVTTAPQNVTVTARVTDDLSGVSYGCLRFVSPSTGQSTDRACFNRTSGTVLDGMYQATATVPRSSEAGTWKLDYLELYDNAGNSTFPRTADLLRLGLPTDLAVLSTTADTQVPEILTITFAPAAIDVSNGPQSITMTIALTDNLSGIDFSRFLEWRVILRSPSGRQEQYIAGRDFQLVSGTALNGVWRATHIFPQHAEAGVWSVSDLWLSDLADNERYLRAADLAAAGLTTTLTVVSAMPDTAPPQLTGFTFTPLLIDTSGASRTVTVTVNMTDNSSGVSFAPDHPSGLQYTRAVEFRSPSRAQIRYSGLLNLVGGSPQNGIWQGTAVFPQYSESGTWTIRIIRFKDVVNNFFDVSTADLAAKNWLTQLVIYQPNLRPDGTVTTGGGTVVDSVFNDRAKLDVPPGVLKQPTLIAIDVLSGNLGVPDPAGYQLGTFYVNFDFDPKPAMPLPSPGITVTLPLQKEAPAGTPMILYRVDPISGPVPAERAASCPQLISSVNADEFSATFTCVVRFSTLVAFFQTAVPGDVNGDGKADCADIAIVRAAFGKATGDTGYDARADLNRDRVVNVIDLALVSRQLPAGTVCQQN
jgi:hypothetical protein